MPGLVPGIHVFVQAASLRRGWPGQARPCRRNPRTTTESLTMSIADKLVLQRQRHLKWRSFDKLELIMMILCGVLCFGFFLSVTDGDVTRPSGGPGGWGRGGRYPLRFHRTFSDP